MVSCPLALTRVASDPVSVRQPAIAFPASFTRSLTVPGLRFPLVTMTCSQEDLLLQVDAHAGRTQKKAHLAAGLSRSKSTELNQKPETGMVASPSAESLSSMPHDEYG